MALAELPSAHSRSVRNQAAAALYDGTDCVLAQPGFAANQTVAAACGEQCEHLRREPIGFGPLPRLAAKALCADQRRFPWLA